MTSFQRRLSCLALIAVAAMARPTAAYVDLAPTMAKVISDSRSIAVVEFSELDRKTGVLKLKEIKPLKGDRGAVPLTQTVVEREGATVPRSVVQWAQPGAHAVVFSTRTTAIVCLGTAWIQLRFAGGQWKLGADRPELALTYYGSASRLEEGVEKMLAGGDAILTMMPHAIDQSASFDLSLNRIAYPGLVKLERIRANLKMPGTVWTVSNSPNYLIGLGPIDEQDLPAAIQRLTGPDISARAAAAEDIRQLTEVIGAARTRSAVPALEKVLSDPSPAARFHAAATLMRIVRAHEGAPRVLWNGLGSPEPNIRRQAATAAGLSGRAGETLVPSLAKLLDDPNDAIQFAALQALATLGPAAAGARDAVVPFLDRPDYRIDAADALGRMGPRAQPVSPSMVKMLSSEETAVRLAALRGMSQIGGKEALPAAEYIAREIGKASEIDAYNMVEYLALMGPVARAPAAKIKSVPIPNYIVFQATNWAMNAPAGLPWLDGSTSALGDLGSFVYAAYVIELGERLRPCALTLAPRLMAGTAGDVPEWAYNILNAAPAESIATIAPHLADKDKVMRERAAVILGRMGPPAEAARTHLEKAIAATADDREKNLLAWALREVTKD
jgi:hypothetical protein